MNELLYGGRLVTPAGLLEQGWLLLAGDTIDAIGSGEPPYNGGPTRHLEDAWVLPGFVDLHVHGGGGASLIEGVRTDVQHAVAYHRSTGTACMLASTVCAPLEQMLAATSRLADLADEGLIAGIHLEGPFLSPARAGALDARHMLRPDRTVLRQLMEAGRGNVRMVTVAPELDGALDLIREVVACGALAAIGHTNATYEQAQAGITAGARVATHLFNSMPPLHHREPGAAVACIEHPNVTCELIADGVHVHDAALRLVFAAAGAGRVALITDAIAAAGAGDGTYRAGDTEVVVTGGIARLLDGSSLAGSTLTTAKAAAHCLKLGLSAEAVATAASTVPARLLSLDDTVGTIEAGKRADLVVFDSSYALKGVVSGGRWRSGK